MTLDFFKRCIVSFKCSHKLASSQDFLFSSLPKTFQARNSEKKNFPFFLFDSIENFPTSFKVGPSLHLKKSNQVFKGNRTFIPNRGSSCKIQVYFKNAKLKNVYSLIFNHQSRLDWLLPSVEQYKIQIEFYYGGFQIFAILQFLWELWWLDWFEATENRWNRFNQISLITLFKNRCNNFLKKHFAWIKARANHCK